MEESEMACYVDIFLVCLLCDGDKQARRRMMGLRLCFLYASAGCGVPDIGRLVVWSGGDLVSGF
jgi:hypothetical protein